MVAAMSVNKTFGRQALMVAQTMASVFNSGGVTVGNSWQSFGAARICQCDHSVSPTPYNMTCWQA